MRYRIWMLSLVALVSFCAPICAQSMTGHDVNVKQLTKSDLEKAKEERNPGETKSAEAPKERELLSASEVERIFKSMVDGFRSACCPHQEMRDQSCPCFLQQTMMLRFLIMQGFPQDEIRQFMINGGPKELRQEYIQYLNSNGHSNPNEFLARSFELKSGMRGPGWDKGWTSLIEETPRDASAWVLVMILGLFVAVAFVVGFVILKRGNAAEAPKEGEKAELTDEMRAQIEREARALEDES